MTDHQYGPNGHIVDAFTEHLRNMIETDRDKVIATGNATWCAGNAARCAGDAAGGVARDATWYAVRLAAGDASGDATWYAVWEIQGADLMRERGYPFYFLPMFGFADEMAVLAALQPKDEK